MAAQCTGLSYLFQAFLDLVEDHESIQWVGNANELNAVSPYFPIDLDLVLNHSG